MVKSLALMNLSRKQQVKLVLIPLKPLKSILTYLLELISFERIFKVRRICTRKYFFRHHKHILDSKLRTFSIQKLNSIAEILENAKNPNIRRVC